MVNVRTVILKDMQNRSISCRDINSSCVGYWSKWFDWCLVTTKLVSNLDDDRVYYSKLHVHVYTLVYYISKFSVSVSGFT